MSETYWTAEQVAIFAGVPVARLFYERLHGSGLGTLGFRDEGQLMFVPDEVRNWAARA